jgi:hypothetical protein
LLHLKVKTGNSAFEGDNKNIELARILRKVADEIEFGYYGENSIKDIKGNTVGEYRITNR